MNRTHRRRILLEQMEKRLLLAGDTVHNFLLPQDVNDDQVVSSMDALVIINALSRGDSGAEPESVDVSIRDLYVDVNDDGQVSLLDALLVINDLSLGSDAVPASELIEGEGESRARVELEIDASGRAEFEVKMVGAPAEQIYDVVVGGETLGQLQTDSQGRGHLELEFGNEGPVLPNILANASATTTIEIGDQVSGTLGTLGEIESSDGESDGLSDGLTDGDADSIRGSATTAANGSPNSNTSSDGSVDDDSEENSDGGSDADSDADSDGGSDAGSDGDSD